ncbi:MAG: hypothetical protein M0P49_03760 [Bacilli bacterium]|jgi:hypothetical protein|nr:hypothetical protein [Bacilli bacterium]
MIIVYKSICDEYKFQRDKLSPLPDSDADFIALENTYNNLSDKQKLEAVNVMINSWRKRCLHAESLLIGKQKELHMKMFFSPKHLKLEGIIVK